MEMLIYNDSKGNMFHKSFLNSLKFFFNYSPDFYCVIDIFKSRWEGISEKIGFPLALVGS